ncbi:MAG TPA: trypsin-like peptidase domain-containing protein [Armatimonadota bacterium]|nr:trypsin-like peptidase domain-containing protein [Armatimonadota bacterium]
MRSAEEQTVIRVAKQARPAVVSVSRDGGSGSGVIIRADGVILTNAHVVGDAKTVGVRLSDGRKLEGQVLGADPAVDVAVVRVNASNLQVAPLANSDRLEVGQAAIAIGNPLGLDGTLTTGVVSAINRQRSLNDFVNFIQTDAAINPGNSGGPLLDSEGRVMGINTWIMGRTTGLGFAVPINLAREVATQVLETGTVRRVIIGIVPTSVTPEIAASLKLPVSEGAAVVEVQPGSPAEKSGLLANDVITRVDGKAIAGAGDLRRILRERKAGDNVALTVRRAEQTLTLTVQLADGSKQ